MLTPAALHDVKTQNAKTLLGICAILAVIVFFFNSSVLELQERQRLRSMWYSEVGGDMIDRWSQFQTADVTFYSSVCYQSLTNSPYVQMEVGLQELANRNLHDLCLKYGETITNLMMVSGNRPIDYEQEKQGLRKMFGFSKSAQDIVSKLLDALIEQNESKNWNYFVDWIVNGSISFHVGGSSYGTSPPGVGFGAANELWESQVIEKYHLTTKLRRGARSSTDDTLNAAWTNAFEAEQSELSDVRLVSIPGVPSAFRPYQLLMLSAPIVVFFQALFLIAFKRFAESRGTNAELIEDTRRSSFPDFGCRGDPWTGGHQLLTTERIVWSLFLVAPPLLISVGVILRYGFYYSIGPDWSFIKALRWSQDAASVVLDWVNVACLWMSLRMIRAIVCMEKRSFLPNRFVASYNKALWLFAIPERLLLALAVVLTAVEALSWDDPTKPPLHQWGVVCAFIGLQLTCIRLGYLGGSPLLLLWSSGNVLLVTLALVA